jgi:hypothetical protein
MATKDQLEAENKTLRELTAALIAMLAVIGGAEPPLPDDDGDLDKYDAERARRLGSVTIWADPSSALPDGLRASTITGRTEMLRKTLARPLKYQPSAVATAAAALTAEAPEANGSAS